MEEEWDDNELELVPRCDAIPEVDFGDGACHESYDLQKVCTIDSIHPSAFFFVSWYSAINLCFFARSLVQMLQ